MRERSELDVSLWNDDSITLMPNLIYALPADASRSRVRRRFDFALTHPGLACFRRGVLRQSPRFL